MSDERWTEVQPSEHAHEREALASLRARLSDTDPWRVWSNFTFVDNNGRPSEVDVLDRRTLGHPPDRDLVVPGRMLDAERLLME